jgi:Cytochrome c554 and c-prime
MTRRVWRFFSALAICGVAAMGADAPRSSVILPHPASTNDKDKPVPWERARIHETCAGCHVEIAAEWKESRHHLAFTNEPFQRSLARESSAVHPFCQGCHAPEANPLVPPSPLVAEMGIGCVTCHAPRGPILAANGSSAAPHGLLRTAEFATDAACANCHQFLFPGQPGQAGLHMQKTMDEHAHNANGKTCADCHMPRTTGERPHKDHRFPGGYDASLWQNALDIHAERLSTTRIRVTLEPKDVTHAVPTGDLFRRIAVEVTPDESAAKNVQTKFLARHFDRRGAMHETSDDRVFVDSRALEFDVPPGAVHIRVRYERVANHRSPNEHEADVESSFLLNAIRLEP